MSPDVVGPAVVGGAVVLVTEGNLAHGMTYYSGITEIVSAFDVWVITVYGLVMVNEILVGWLGLGEVLCVRTVAILA